MAKISDKFLEFKGSASFNRIPITSSHDHWYVTTGKNSVTKVQDSKSVHTWTLLQGHIHFFTTPVAFFSGQLFAVVDGNVLLKWFDKDINLENSEKIKLQEEVHSIVHLEGTEPFIVFQSGKFLIGNFTELTHLQPAEPKKLKQSDCLEWVDAVVSATSIEAFYLVFNKKNKERTLYHFSVNKEDKTVSLCDTFPVSHENASFKVCCLNYQDLTFFSLWSDGTLKCHNVKDSSTKVILSLGSFSIDTKTDICCIDSKHIIIVKLKPKNEDCLLEIWDTEHLILRGSRNFKAPESVSVQISSTNDYIFLNFASEKLIVIPYFLDSSFASTLHASEPKEFQEIAWNTDLEVKQISPEVEPMDVSFVNPNTLDSLEELAEKLLNEDSFDLKFISESELIKILQVIFRHLKESKDDSNKNIYNLLNIVFSASFNDVLLIKHLKLLNLEDVLVILDFLLKYLKHRVNTGAVQRPSDLQIVNWICLIISSHTETLLFTKDKAVKKLLKELKKTLSVKVQEFEDLEGLQSYLSLYSGKKNILPQQYSIEKYCLETLDI